jgi:signal transduction histidine kinase
VAPDSPRDGTSGGRVADGGISDRPDSVGGAVDPTDPDHDTGDVGLRERLSRLADATDGSARTDAVAMLEKVDRVAAFNPAILSIRWGATAVSVALAVSSSDLTNGQILFWCVAITSYTIFRTFRPLRYMGDVRSLVATVGEVGFHILAVGMTGYWESPFVFTLFPGIILAGFARGFAFSLRIAAVSALAVSIPYLYPDDATSQDLRVSAQWCMTLLLIALVAGYARRISGEADRQHSQALDRLGRLADANALLFSLHRDTQTLPASLDLDEVLDTTIGRLRGLFDFDTAVIFVLEDTDANWSVIRREGVRLAARLAPVELPPPLQRAVADESVVFVDDLQGVEGPGLAGHSGTGMYAVLQARGSVIGLLAVESKATAAYTPRDVELFRGFVEPVALAIDNARRFGRLRTVGADEERTRIARDLHDRIGQSLAYLAFELDRIVANNQTGTDIGGELQQLRGDVRGVIGEVRDTLYDLRTDVTEERGIGQVVAEYAERVRERSKLAVTVTGDHQGRLPILQEREMWRIAQEAITNVERHASASELTITWRCNGRSAALEVADNGHGFPISTAGRMDSYGLLGMRERASSIGATLDISSSEGGGTSVRCHLAAE